MREVAASPVLTAGEPLSAVLKTPNTVHGWRPISVKIQPNEFASSGMATVVMAAVQSQRLVGVRPLRLAHRASAAIAMARPPKPIIRRNDQYVIGTLGV